MEGAVANQNNDYHTNRCHQKKQVDHVYKLFQPVWKRIVKNGLDSWIRARVVRMHKDGRVLRIVPLLSKRYGEVQNVVRQVDIQPRTSDKAPEDVPGSVAGLGSSGGRGDGGVDMTRWKCKPDATPDYHWNNPSEKCVGGNTAIQEAPYKHRSANERFEDLVELKDAYRRFNKNLSSDELDKKYHSRLTIVRESWRACRNANRNIAEQAMRDQTTGLEYLWALRRRMNILSLCGGTSPELKALRRLGIPIGTVVCVDTAVDSIGIAVQQNPDVHFKVVQARQGGDMGDIELVSKTGLHKIIIDSGGFDLVVITTPCNDYCLANHRRQGTNGRSGSLLKTASTLLHSVRELCPNALYVQVQYRLRCKAIYILCFRIRHHNSRGVIV